MNKKAYAFFLKKNRPRNQHNPMAIELQDNKYNMRVIKNKKKYNRKRYKNATK
jgi:hypothetical protein|tara:strand:+ start:165 stop:323 length:159 start_codon:yes stop_codon:yes gene_type:complete